MRRVLAQTAASDPGASFAFGLETIIAGIELIPIERFRSIGIEPLP